MARINHFKFICHLLYILLISYFISLRTYKIVTTKVLDRFLPDMKHILIWTDIQSIQGEGQDILIEEKCRTINCYFTKNRQMYGDLRYFDVILFSVQDVSKGSSDLPQVRGIHQKYIFVANESSDRYPVCDSVYDKYFNWTWSYRVDSTISFRFVSVYNIHGEKLGSHFPWKPNMSPLKVFLKSQLLGKSKAVAVFLDECKSKSGREDWIKRLAYALKTYNLTVDIYGECGPFKCKKKRMSPCYYKLKKNYFFYLAIENAISEDYITDLVVTAYDNWAVPIVYGGADYKKFLPPGSYINGMAYTEEALAQKINQIMKNNDLYAKYFDWQNHYVIKAGSGLDVCDLCDNLNDPSWVTRKSTYGPFRQWWNPNYKWHCPSRFSFLK